MNTVKVPEYQSSSDESSRGTKTTDTYSEASSC